MRNSGNFPQKRGQKKYLTLAIPLGFPRGWLRIMVLVGVVMGSNWMTFRYARKDGASSGGAPLKASAQLIGSDLYLMDKAVHYVQDVEPFEERVREISGMLNIPPEWLMAVMYAESKFDAAIVNLKGSGAVGLIQFMPETAINELNVTPERLKRMNPLQQLEYVYIYLQTVRERYGEYKSLPDLYLGVLYPKARNQDECFTLYGKPSEAYRQNAGLDENHDGRVTISDIDHRMLRLYPTAYHVKQTETQLSWMTE